MKYAEPHSNDKLLRKWEVADRLACSVRTVEREVNDGHLTRIKVRRNVCFRESEVNKIINRRNNDF
jgi:excisionase family DNA binding protein